MKHRAPLFVSWWLASLFALCLAPLRAAAVDHSGTCTGTFAAAQNPHKLTGSCQVPAGQTLTIQAGVVLVGQSNTLQVLGTLNANGTVANPIQASDVYWDFEAGSAGTLNHCTTTGATYVTITDASPSVTNCTLNGTSYGILVGGSMVATPAAPMITGNTINVQSYGMYLTGTAQPVVTNNTISTNGVGIQYQGSSAGTASGNTIGFLAQGGSNREGIAVLGSGAPTIDANTILDDTTGSDIGILLQETFATAVQITNNTIHASGGDFPIEMTPNVFGPGPVISGNLFPDGTAAGFGLYGTLTDSATIGALQGHKSYVSVGGVTVANGATMTIAPGIHVDGGPGYGIDVAGGGTLNAVGTSSAQRDVQFTDLYITFDAGSAGQLANCTMTGGPYVSITDASPTVTNCTISGSSYAIAIGGSVIATPAQPVITGNTISAQSYAVYVSGSAQPAVTNNAITANNTAIRYLDSSAGTASGNTIGFPTQAGNNRGGIVILGSAAPVIDGNIILDDTTESDVGIVLQEGFGTTIQLTNNMIHASGGDFPIELTPNVFGPGPVISGNLFPDGIAAGFGLYGTLTESATVGALQGQKSYVSVGQIAVANGVTMTIAPGIHIDGGPGYGIEVVGGATLNAVGTSSAQRDVQFTNLYVTFDAGSAGQLANCTISGGPYLNITDASPSVTNCTISGATYGMIIGGSLIATPAQPLITGNTISAQSYAVYVGGSAQPMLTNNTITSNGVGIYYRDSSAGTASGNTIGFQTQAGQGRVGIDVYNDAAPVLANNTIIDDPTESDIGIRLLENPGVPVQVTNNIIHASGGDRLIDASPNAFAPGAVISGNQFPDGVASGIGIGGQLLVSATLGDLQGNSTYYLTTTLQIGGGATLTLAPGITLRGDLGDVSYIQTLEVQTGGTLAALGTSAAQRDVHFANVIVQFDAGSAGQVEHCTSDATNPYYYSGSVYISDASPEVSDCVISTPGTGIGITGASQANPAAPTISNNTIIAGYRAVNIFGTAQPLISGNTITTNSVGLLYSDSAAGTASGNTIGFQTEAGPARIGIEVDEDAAPLLSNNTINDDTTENDIGLRLAENAGVAVQVINNTIHASGGDRVIDASPNAFAPGPTITGNQFPDGIASGLGIGGALQGTATLGTLQGLTTYYLTTTVQVSNGSALTIAPGVTLRGDLANVSSAQTLDVQAGGSLTAIGTSQAQRDVHFNNVFVQFDAGSAGVLEHCTVAGANLYYYYGAVIIADAAPTVMDCTLNVPGTGVAVSGTLDPTTATPLITGNTITAGRDGIDISGTAAPMIEANTFVQNPLAVGVGSGVPVPNLSGNVFDRNTLSLSFATADALFSSFPPDFNSNTFIGRADQNLIDLAFTTIESSGTIRAAKVPYRVNNMTIASGATVVVEPGTVLANGIYTSLVVDGDLVAAGTATKPIVFTSQTPKNGTRWQGLQLNNQSPSSPTILDSAIIEYAGGYNNQAALQLDNSSATLRNVTITANVGPGLRATNGGTPDIEDAAIVQNKGDGVIIDSSAKPTFSGGSIFGNGAFGMRSGDCQFVRNIISAQGIYWGDDSGPLDSNDDTALSGGLFNPSGHGSMVTDCIDYDPWIRLAPSVEGTITAKSGGGQTGAPGSALPNPLCVEVKSTIGSLLDHIDVTFSVAAGGGSIETDQPVQTGANGQACAVLRLGPLPGVTEVAATARDVDSPLATFDASGAEALFAARAVAIEGGGDTQGSGDVNGDGNVDLGDAAIIEAVLSGTLPADEGSAVDFTAAGDVNGDGVVDGGDVGLILNSLVGLGRLAPSHQVGLSHRPLRAYVELPATSPAVGDTIRVPVYIRAGADPIAGYALQVHYDRHALAIVAIDGGSAPGFTDSPIVDRRTFPRGRTRFAAVDHAMLRSRRIMKVAEIVFHVIGGSGQQARIRLRGAGGVPLVSRSDYEPRQVLARKSTALSIR